MSTWVELKKYLKNPITLVLLLVSIWLLLSGMVRQNAEYERMSNPLIAEATQAELPLDETGYDEAVDFITEHMQDWVYLDKSGQERFQYEQFYMNKYDDLFAYKMGMMAEKETARSSGLRPKDEERFNLIEQRIKDLSVLRSYDSGGFLRAVIEKLWFAYLLISPLIFASIYAYDKYYISALLAAAPQSGMPYLRAKVRVSLLLGTLIYWLPILTLLIFYLSKTNFLAELSLPYYYISPLSSWDVNIGQGLCWLVLSGFIQFIYLILIFILISQSTRYILVAGLAGFVYSGGAIFGLTWLLPYFDRSPIVRWLVTIWALTPSGALSHVVRHDYFYPSNFLGALTSIKDYNLPLITSTLVMIPLLWLIYTRRRRCYQDSGTSLHVLEKIKEKVSTISGTSRHVSEG